MCWGALILAAGLFSGEHQRATPNLDGWVTREFRSMGTVLRIDVMSASRSDALAASEAAFREVQRIDAIVSSWRRDSDVGRLNATPPNTRLHTPVLAALIGELAGWAAETGGAFDPVVGALVEAWDLRGPGRLPTPDELDAARRRTGMRNLRIDPDDATLEWVVDGTWLDAGGFGKGLAMRAAAQALDSSGVTAARIDFGGQTAALGSGELGVWRVGVAHPMHRHRPVAALRLVNASAATSGQSERQLVVGGTAVGHILDPRSGQFVPAWGSVTVVSADPMAADILATALFVMGPDAAMAWAQERQDVGVLTLEVVGDDLVRRTNHVMEQLLQ
jgi:thiamine biosynthesis lipoprotein